MKDKKEEDSLSGESAADAKVFWGGVLLISFLLGVTLWRGDQDFKKAALITPTSTLAATKALETPLPSSTATITKVPIPTRTMVAPTAIPLGPETYDVCPDLEKVLARGKIFALTTSSGEVAVRRILAVCGPRTNLSGLVVESHHDVEVSAMGEALVSAKVAGKFALAISQIGGPDILHRKDPTQVCDGVLRVSDEVFHKTRGRTYVLSAPLNRDPALLNRSLALRDCLADKINNQGRPGLVFTDFTKVPRDVSGVPLASLFSGDQYHMTGQNIIWFGLRDQSFGIILGLVPTKTPIFL